MHDDKTNEVWRLVKGRAFEEAIRLGRLQFDEGGQRALSVFGNLTQAYLGLGRFSDAYECCRTADCLRQNLGPPGGSYLDDLAKLAWLKGNRQLALEHAREDVHRLNSGLTVMTDSVGGVMNGLFLYFCAVSLQSPSDRTSAVEFLVKLSKRLTRFLQWPGPLGAFVLGNSTIDNVLLSATAEQTLNGALSKAQRDLLSCRQTIVALFYIAAKMLEQGERYERQRMLQYCVALTNPYIELEWYIAKEQLSQPWMS